MNDRIILGIDPGTTVMGFAIIIAEGQKLQMVEMNVLKLGTGEEHFDKLTRIYHKVSGLISSHAVNELSIEAPFFGKNVQSMLKLGRAQGICIAAALASGISVHEYSPRKVKQSITGKGSSSKEQVALMLERLIVFTSRPSSHDATDALAVAVCHYFQSGKPASSAKSLHKGGSWKAFLSQNPGRVK